MTRTTNIKKWLRFAALGGLFAFIIIYSFIEMRFLSSGVDLSVSGISNGQVFTHEFVELTGTAKHAIKLFLNGRAITIDETNAFSEALVLSPGYNIITLEAKDRFDKTTSEVYEVFYENAPTASNEQVTNI